MSEKKLGYLKDISMKRLKNQSTLPPLTPLIIRIFQFVLVMFMLSHAAFATKIDPTDLRVLVKRADYILTGEVVKVDMVDEKGNLVFDGAARTGPGLSNTIQLYVRLNRKHVIKGRKSNIPEFIIVPEWQMWHMTLHDGKDMEGKTFIFLLNEKFEPSSAPEFVRILSEQREIERYVR